MLYYSVGRFLPNPREKPSQNVVDTSGVEEIETCACRHGMVILVKILMVTPTDRGNVRTGGVEKDEERDTSYRAATEQRQRQSGGEGKYA
eukprot:m.86647 g.86647  ORF g.86647 m.86647 type:complete len:90 (+) comp25986_c0_seq2:3136-3405(+)